MATIAVRSPAPALVQPWVRRFVRIGYAAKGVIYFLIGTLALRLASGEGGRLIDENGVLLRVLHQPFGLVLLTAIGIGLVAYAGWEVLRALVHRSARGWVDRSLSIVKGLVYGAIGVQAMRFVLGAPGRATDADGFARSTMRLPLGEVLLAAIGAGVAIYGANQIRQAWNSEFDDDLDQHRLRREGGGWVLTIGRAGIGARGVILTLMGAAFVRAAFNRAPTAAKDIGEAMAMLFSQQYGSLLLAAVAAGVMCYGIFQLLHARYARL